jgi:uncharacterized membrane protein
MRNELLKNKQQDSRIHYRGESASRLDNLTDAVFGIAITLLIFNLANPNSFADLLTFTKTLPAFLISISFLVLIWNEHLTFSEVYGLKDTGLVLLNTIFIALVIFYVYPLRFLTMFLTNFFFVWASFVGGIVYVLYTPLIIAWHHQFKKQSKAFVMP